LEDWELSRSSARVQKKVQLGVRVFCSFLDLASLHLVSLFFRYRDKFRLMTNRSYYIELIFLPVSRSRKKNAYLITNLRDIVKSLSHDVKLHILEEKLNFLKVAALNMIMKQRIAFLQNMRQQGRKLGVGKTEKFKKLENWHLFPKF